MKAEQLAMSNDLSTEEKIKLAARKVFYRKGFAATRTRDIADEAGINLALLNYYFRSKAKLFEIIMLETLGDFVQQVVTVLNDEATSFDQKIEKITDTYIDFILKEPEIPAFIITELRQAPEILADKLPVKEILYNSVFARQHLEAVQAGEITEPNPLHIMVNIAGLVIFPFVTKPILLRSRGFSDEAFLAMMLERKTLIPKWFKAMMKA